MADAKRTVFTEEEEVKIRSVLEGCKKEQLKFLDYFLRIRLSGIFTMEELEELLELIAKKHLFCSVIHIKDLYIDLENKAILFNQWEP